MNKIISISLWGDNPRYSVGAIKNAKLAQEIFPDWTVRIYFSNVIESHLQQLKQFNNVSLIDCSREEIAPCFWRFFSLFESENNVTLLRDSDSRLSLREKHCVDLWLLRSDDYIIIRDHIRHYDFPILAGMWGYKGKMPEEFYQKMFVFGKENFYTIDQIYLREVVWPFASIKSSIFGLSEDKQFFESRKEILPHFVGQGYDEFDRPIYPVE